MLTFQNFHKMFLLSYKAITDKHNCRKNIHTSCTDSSPTYNVKCQYVNYGNSLKMS